METPSSPRRTRETAPLGLILVNVALLVAIVATGVLLVSRTLAERRLSDADLMSIKAASQEYARTGTTASELRLASAYQLAGEYTAATREYQAVLSRDTNNTEAHYNLAVLDELTGNVTAAREEYRATLKIEPTHLLAAQRLAALLIGSGEWAEVERVIRPVLSTHGDLADLHYMLGLSFEKRGQRAKAAAEYRTALKYVPQYDDARAGLARMK